MSNITQHPTTKDCTQSAHRDTPGAPCSGDQGDCAMGLHRKITPKATLLRLGNIVDLSNTYQKRKRKEKKTQGGSQNEKTKKHVPNERTGQNSRKEIK